MIKWGAYWRLCRFDKPIGTLLLWYPTAWALWIANKGYPDLRLCLLFFLGTVFMRAAGCVINDIADRNIDKHVSRTLHRPLAANEISLLGAFTALGLLLFAALLVLINLPLSCYPWALLAVFVTFLYPFCKRFINAPQMVLGLAFSMGIPMAYAASNVAVNRETLILFCINFCWIVAYDTMYAMTDKADDLKIGVKSTAIYFGRYDRLIIGSLLACLHGLWLYWAVMQQIGSLFYMCWSIAGLVLVYQQKLIHQRQPQNCFKAFLISNYYGALMWLGVVSLGFAF